MHVSRTTVGVLSTAALAASSLVGLAVGPAQAAVPTCYADSCYGKDPTTTYSSRTGALCTSGAYAVENTNNPSDSTPIGKLHLLYSPGCAANWAEADSTPAAELELYVWNAEEEHKATTYFGSVSYNWTLMVNGEVDAGACLSDVDVYLEMQPKAGTPPTSCAL